MGNTEEECLLFHQILTTAFYTDGNSIRDEEGDSGLEEDKDDDDTKIVKSLKSRFSCGKLEAGMNGLGLCTARERSKSCCWCVLKV